MTSSDLPSLSLGHEPEFSKAREEFLSRLDFAIVEWQDMKMQPALERALGRRGLPKA